MENENYINEPIMDQDEELDSKTKFIVRSVLIAILIVVAFFLNPKAAAHQQKVNEIVDHFERNHTIRNSEYEFRPDIPDALRHVEYHNLGILSYTTAKDPKVSGFLTIGVFGYVHPLFKMGFY